MHGVITPTVFHHTAQGCEARVTLGNRRQKRINPAAGCINRRPAMHPSRAGATPLGVGVIFLRPRVAPEDFGATLGYRMERLCRSSYFQTP